MDFDFFMPVRVLSGENIISKSADFIFSFGRKCGIVTGRTSAKRSGALSDVLKVFESEGIEYIIYDKITENPLISSCREAGVLFSENGVDFIFGIGGGSALDAAKAVAIYASNPSLAEEDIYLREYSRQALPVLLIGTTGGTGSEVSGVSVLTNPKTGRKKSISGQDCYAKAVFADSRYNESMPYSVTVSTALDALSHAVEGYFTPKCTDIPMMFAEKAIPMLFEALCRLDAVGEEKFDIIKDEKNSLFIKEIHEKLYFGSLYAGMVLNPCGTVFPHPLGYVLTENYGIPHGKACTAFMTELTERAYIYEKEKCEKLFSLLMTDKASFCAVIERLTNLPEIRMTQAEIDDYCSRWGNVTVKNFVSTPGGFSKSDAEKIFISRFLSRNNEKTHA